MGSGCVAPRGRAPGTQRIGGWVGSEAYLGAVEKKKIPDPIGIRTSTP
jgi:hypothetical protein